ncbi:MAG: type VI secretion system tip protein VgrG [Chlorobiaceae bacterium]|nr:type VI secretion system tip protein VgrG [Chlorobiaceae bacterium]
MSLSSLSPGSNDATDVVSQTILVGGEPLNNEIGISYIVVNKSFNKVASAKIVFFDGSVSDRDFSLSNEDTLKPGNEITIQLGYHGEVETVFSGIIVRHALKARQAAPSLLVIEAKDKAVKLTGARKSAYFINKSDSEVLTGLAGELQTEIEETALVHKQLVQFDSTDWDFICTRAEANGMLVLTDDGMLIVKKPSTDGTPLVTATNGDNIFEFEAEMDARRQAQQITSHSWDYTSQQVEESDSGSVDFSENGNISSEDLATVMSKQVSFSHPGHLTQDQLQDWSNAGALRNQLSKLVGRVRIEGSASFKPGVMITLDGVGERFNGNVFVTGVLHTYDGNWLTDIQFGWKDDWFYNKENVMDKPASGLLPGINGLQTGIVLDTDDSEDGGQYRVKVHIPTITSGNEGFWARVATLDAGPNRGVYFRPQQNDEVVLGFLGDDPREPIILGYLHSKSCNQSPLPEQEGAEQYGFVTKEGLKLIFDDTSKKMTLVVPAASGEKSIVINDTSGAMELKDENQNSIKMDAQGITIQSSTGIVTIKGTQVMIN